MRRKDSVFRIYALFAPCALIVYHRNLEGGILSFLDSD